MPKLPPVSPNKMIKLLEALSRCSEMRVMQPVGTIRAAYNEVNRNLELMKAEGIVADHCPEKIRYGKVRVVLLNREDHRTKKLLQALQVLDEEDDASIKSC